MHVLHCSSSGTSAAAAASAASSLAAASAPESEAPPRWETFASDADPDCQTPEVADPNFSASQVAYLASDLQKRITEPCYSVVVTSLAVCVPDLSLQSGCCRDACSKALQMVRD